MILISSALLLLVAGVPALLLELLPHRPPPDAFDAHLFFELRSRALTRQPWWDHRGKLRPEVAELLRMYGFWALVWGAKLTFTGVFLMPTLFDTHAGLQAAPAGA